MMKRRSRVVSVESRSIAKIIEISKKNLRKVIFLRSFMGEGT